MITAAPEKEGKTSKVAVHDFKCNIDELIVYEGQAVSPGNKVFFTPFITKNGPFLSILKKKC